MEIDADLSNLSPEMKHVMSLINPANTYMVLNLVWRLYVLIIFILHIEIFVLIILMNSDMLLQGFVTPN